jgi:hypothetical protein
MQESNLGITVGEQEAFICGLIKQEIAAAAQLLKIQFID